MIKKLLKEGLTRIKLSKGPEKLFEVVKDYYKFSNDIEENIRLVNELYDILEAEDFDPFSHTATGDLELPYKNVCFLKFSEGNTKLEWPYFSLPAGYTCPFATVCKSFAAKPNQKFKDNSSLKKASDKTEYTCYAARQQAQYKNTNKTVFNNLSLLKLAEKEGGINGMVDLIIESIKYANLENIKIFRIHESGDFYSNNYFKAWIKVAEAFPNINFYAYTTSLKYWISNKGSIPKNMRLVASMDKNNKDTIIDNGLRYSLVVYSVEEAKELMLPIDYDDTLACCSDTNFALLLHGGQFAGSKASDAFKSNLKSGIYDKLKDLHKKNKPSREKLLRNS